MAIIGKATSFFFLYSAQLENIMEVHSVMEDENFSRSGVDLCRGYMLDMVDYYVNFYRKLGEMFGHGLLEYTDR